MPVIACVWLFGVSRWGHACPRSHPRCLDGRGASAASVGDGDDGHGRAPCAMVVPMFDPMRRVSTMRARRKTTSQGDNPLPWRMANTRPLELVFCRRAFERLRIQISDRKLAADGEEAETIFDINDTQLPLSLFQRVFGRHPLPAR